LMVSPDISLLRSLFNGANGIFPPVHISQSIAMRKAATGKANKFWMYIRQQLCQVGPQTIGSVFKCFSGKKRYYVHGKFAFGGGILPVRKRVPFFFFGGTIFKRTILHHFCIQTTIGGVIDVFEK